MLTFDRPTLVTITAPTASGKNYLRDAIEKQFGWNRIVSTTTRKMRSGEVHGEDYDFITTEESHRLEKYSLFAELIEFRGTRYGVTKTEMGNKMNAVAPPMVILEPQGLAIYKRMCVENKWDVFSIYIHAVESLRIERLVKRTVADIQDNEGSANHIEGLVKTHTDRILSITGEERSWMNASSWNAIVPGDDLVKALDYIERGVEWTNRKNRTPAPYTHVV